MSTKIKVGVADYGMNVWDGNSFDYEQRCLDLKGIGYEGIERLKPVDSSDAIHRAAMVKKHGLDFATCLAPTAEMSIQWTAAFGKKYVWTDVSAKNFGDFCRQVNKQAEAAKRYGIHVTLHNHLGSLVETQEQLLAFLDACPDCFLVLDTGHLALGKGGDPLYIVRHYFDRIAAVHVKEWVMKKPDAENWWERGWFCELGGGNTPIDNEGVVKALLENGYGQWIFVEHDTHLREPLIDLKISRDILSAWGV